MGQQSNATLAWLNNLLRPVNPHNPTVEEVSNNEDEDFQGAAKLIYRTSPKTKDMKEMEENVKNSLDDVPIVQIQRWAYRVNAHCQRSKINSLSVTQNHVAWFISTYDQGLSSPEAVWANRKYHGHRTLPPEMATKLKDEHEQRYGTQVNNL